MSAAAKKIQDIETPAVETAPSDEPTVRAFDFSVDAAAPSPAKQMQEQLVAEWDGREEKFPARYVTATVCVFCLASWFAAYMFYASL